MSEPSIVSSEEAQRRLDGAEPERTRAAVIKALDEALDLIQRHGVMALRMVERRRNQIENGADL